VFRELDTVVTSQTLVVNQAFLAENASFSADMVIVTCAGEQPVPCMQDVIKDCTATDTILAPMHQCTQPSSRTVPPVVSRGSSISWAKAT